MKPGTAHIDAVNTIYGYLNDTIITNYRRGVIESVKQFNNDYRRGKFADDLFKVEFNRVDALAVKSFKLEAFAVANVGSLELNDKLKDLYVQLKNDRSQFDLEARKLMLDCGIGLQEDQMPAGWLESQMLTAELRSHSSARWIKVNDPDVTELYPAIKTFTRGDDRVRESHVKMYQGKMYLKSDPLITSILPPAPGQYRCRCTWQAVAAWDIPDIKAIEPISKAETKENIPVEKGVNPADMNSIYESYLQSKFKDLSEQILKELRDKLNEFARQQNLRAIQMELLKPKPPAKDKEKDKGKDDNKQ